MPNPDFVDFSNEQASTGAITVNLCNGWNAGNILILYVATDGFTPTLSTPNGYVLAQDPNGNTASVNIPGVCGMHIFWKRALGNQSAGLDPAPVIAAPSGGGTVQCCHQNSYNNCRATGTPFHIITTATVGTATTAITTPGVTTTLADCTVFGVAASEEDDSLFNSWGFTATAASPAGTIDSGWHTNLGNRCSWAGGRGGYAAAGGPRSGTSSFATSTRQAQIGFALASLNENASFGTEVNTSSSSSLASTATVAVTGNETNTSSGSVPSITGTTLTTRTGTETNTSSDSTPAITGLVTGGRTANESNTSSNSSITSAGTVAISANAANTSSGSLSSETGTVSVSGTAVNTLGGSSPFEQGNGLPPLAIGAATIRQKANSSGPGTGTLTTLAVYPNWATSTAYTLIGETRVTNAGNMYQCSQSGTSASSGGGPTGTGTSIVDGTCRWDFIGAGTGACDTQATGSVILVTEARGAWSTPGTGPSDNKSGNVWPLQSLNFYQSFPSSANALYADITAAGGSGHTFSMDWGETSPGSGSGDEVTIAAVEVKGGTFIKALSYVEAAPVANVVTSAAVVTTAPAVLVSIAWLNGIVRTPGTSHLATYGSGFTSIPQATALMSLDAAGYIQCAIGFRDAPTPGSYTSSITTNSGEGAGIYLVAIQAVDGAVGNESNTSSGSIPSITGTVSTARVGTETNTAGANSPVISGTVVATAVVNNTNRGSQSQSAGTITITGSEQATLGSSAPLISGFLGAQSLASVQSTLGASSIASAGTVGVVATEQAFDGSSTLTSAGSVALVGSAVTTSGSGTVLAVGLTGNVVPGAVLTSSGASSVVATGVVIAPTRFGNEDVVLVGSKVVCIGTVANTAPVFTPDLFAEFTSA